MFERQKEAMAKLNEETDTLEAFVALGGAFDKTGAIATEKLSKVCKVCGGPRARPPPALCGHGWH